MRPDLSYISPHTIPLQPTEPGATGGGCDELTALVDRLRWNRRRDPHSGRRDYVRTADELADRCGQLLAAGQAATVVPVLRRAVDRMTHALASIDDVSGGMGNELYRLMTLYAQACRTAGRAAEAVDWAQRGVADERASWLTDRLRDILVDLLVESGDPAGAVQERRDEFTRRPTAANWRALRETAARAGADPRLDWAVDLLSARAAGEPAYLTELIDVLLAERRVDEAWQAGWAQFDQLPPRWRGELLELRQATHPCQVQEPYRRLIEEHLLDSGDKRRYQRATALLRQLHRAHLAAGDLAGFEDYLADLRYRHRRRSTFLAQLDRAGL